jgi:putative transposase
VHEIQVARGLRLEAGSLLVFARGYQDYKWFEQLTNQGVHFVTRLKDNARLSVVRRCEPQGAGVMTRPSCGGLVI